MSHNALRLDMKDLTECMEIILKESKNTGEPNTTKTAALSRYFTMFVSSLREHHNGEENVFFPGITKRVQLPPKISADHTALMAQLDEVVSVVRGLSTVQGLEFTAALEQALPRFATFRQMTEEHFAEEERDGIPLIRAHFSVEEVRALVREMTSNMEWYEFPHFLRHLRTMDEKSAWMREVGIPGFVQSFVLLPKCRRFQKEFESLIEEIRREAD